MLAFLVTVVSDESEESVNQLDYRTQRTHTSIDPVDKSYIKNYFVKTRKGTTALHINILSFDFGLFG